LAVALGALWLAKLLRRGIGVAHTRPA
jgi:hypothetical protein